MSAQSNNNGATKRSNNNDMSAQSKVARLPNLDTLKGPTDLCSTARLTKSIYLMS